MKIRSRILLPLAPALLGLPGVVLAASPARDPRVEIVTDMGTIVVQLAPSRAPRTVENFLRYVREGHYAGTVFHRVIQGFMIQGGGFTAEMQQKPVHDPIPLEARGGLPNDRYTIAMARTSYPHSATSQFFINVEPCKTNKSTKHIYSTDRSVQKLSATATENDRCGKNTEADNVTQRIDLNSETFFFLCSHSC